MKGICSCIFLYIDVFNLGFYGIIQLIGRHKVKIKIKQSIKKRRTDTSAFFMGNYFYKSKNKRYLCVIIEKMKFLIIKIRKQGNFFCEKEFFICQFYIF